MEPEKNDTPKPGVGEGVELGNKQLNQIAGGNRPDTCDICGGPMRFYSPTFIMCLRCGREWSLS